MTEKRKDLYNEITEAKDEIKSGDYLTGDYEEVMKAIDDEMKSTT